MNSDYLEAFVPQEGTTLAGNVVAANHQEDTPAQADGGWGVGVGIAGGTKNLVQANLIEDNPTTGLSLTTRDDLPPLGNVIRGNVFANTLDVAYYPTARAAGRDNCLSDNQLRTTAPANLAAVAVCGASGSPEPAPAPHMVAPKGIPFPDVVAPPSGLPNYADVRTVPQPWQATALPVIDLGALSVPRRDLLADQAAIP